MPALKTTKKKAVAPAKKGVYTEAQKRQSRAGAVLFKSISDETRLSICRVLMDGPQSVTGLMTALGCHSQPAISHHLSLLRAANLLEADRDGKSRIYSIPETSPIRPYLSAFESSLV